MAAQQQWKNNRPSSWSATPGTTNAYATSYNNAGYASGNLYHYASPQANSYTVQTTATSQAIPYAQTPYTNYNYPQAQSSPQPTHYQANVALVPSYQQPVAPQYQQVYQQPYSYQQQFNAAPQQYQQPYTTQQPTSDPSYSTQQHQQQQYSPQVTRYDPPEQQFQPYPSTPQQYNQTAVPPQQQQQYDKPLQSQPQEYNQTPQPQLEQYDQSPQQYNQTPQPQPQQYDQQNPQQYSYSQPYAYQPQYNGSSSIPNFPSALPSENQQGHLQQTSAQQQAHNAPHVGTAPSTQGSSDIQKVTSLQLQAMPPVPSAPPVSTPRSRNSTVKREPKQPSLGSLKFNGVNHYVEVMLCFFLA